MREVNPADADAYPMLLLSRVGGEIGSAPQTQFFEKSCCVTPKIQPGKQRSPLFDPFAPPDDRPDAIVAVLPAIDGFTVNLASSVGTDAPIARQNQSNKQIEPIENTILSQRPLLFADALDSTNHPCSPENINITGHFIAPELGFSHVCIL